MTAVNWDAIGGIFSVGSTISGLIGADAAASRQKYELESRGLSYEHQQDMAEINADMLKSMSYQIARAYDQQQMVKTMKDGLQEGTARTRFAKGGVQLGYGSVANVFASSKIMREIDKITMNSNKVRAVNQMRTRGVQADIRSDMLGVSANNMFASASAVSPFLNMTTTLMSGVGDFVAKEGYGWFG